MLLSDTAIASLYAPANPLHAVQQNRLMGNGIQCAAICVLTRLAVLFILATVRLTSAEQTSGLDRQILSAGEFVEAGNFGQAEILYTAVLKSAQESRDDLRAGVILQNLGWLFNRKGNLLQAERAYIRAISILERMKSDDSEVLLRAYIGLSAIYIQTGSLSKAERLIRSVLTDFPNSSYIHKATLKGELGVILGHDKHRLFEAEQVLHEVVSTYADTSDEMQQVRSIAAANLGDIRISQGRIDEAVVMYKQSLSLMRALPGPPPAALVPVLSGYAGSLRRQGNSKMAEAVYQDAIAVSKTTLGPTNPIVAKLFQDYSEFLRQEGRKRESRHVADLAQKIRTQSDSDNLTGHTIEVSALARSK